MSVRLVRVCLAERRELLDRRPFDRSQHAARSLLPVWRELIGIAMYLVLAALVAIGVAWFLLDYL